MNAATPLSYPTRLEAGVGVPSQPAGKVGFAFEGEGKTPGKAGYLL